MRNKHDVKGNKQNVTHALLLIVGLCDYLRLDTARQQHERKRKKHKDIKTNVGYTICTYIFHIFIIIKYTHNRIMWGQPTGGK